MLTCIIYVYVRLCVPYYTVHIVKQNYKKMFIFLLNFNYVFDLLSVLIVNLEVELIICWKYECILDLNMSISLRSSRCRHQLNLVLFQHPRLGTFHIAGVERSVCLLLTSFFYLKKIVSQIKRLDLRLIQSKFMSFHIR